MNTDPTMSSDHERVDHDTAAAAPAGGQLDEFSADIAARARAARRHYGGHPAEVWSTGEQLAVALVLRDKTHLEAMDYTPTQAARRVLDSMTNPPAPHEFTAWLDRIRAAAATDTETRK